MTHGNHTSFPKKQIQNHHNKQQQVAPVAHFFFIAIFRQDKSRRRRYTTTSKLHGFSSRQKSSARNNNLHKLARFFVHCSFRGPLCCTSVQKVRALLQAVTPLASVVPFAVFLYRRWLPLPFGNNQRRDFSSIAVSEVPFAVLLYRRCAPCYKQLIHLRRWSPLLYFCTEGGCPFHLETINLTQLADIKPWLHLPGSPALKALVD